MPTVPIRWSGVTVDCVDATLVARFWAALLDQELTVPLPGCWRIGTLGDVLPVLNFQPVPEPKRDKVRIHLDFEVDDLDDVVKTVHRLGGTGEHERHEYDEGTVLVMADPEGNEFCLVHYTPDGGLS